METSSPDKSRPLYQVVIDDILATIDQGEFSFDHPICTESKLMARHNISRITARRAMTELENRGILYRKRGVGSFVSRDFCRQNESAVSPRRLFAFISPFDLRYCGISTAFSSLNEALQHSGYAASIYITEGGAHARGRKFLNQVIQSDIAGVVYYPKTSDIHPELLNHLLFQGKPVVLLDLPSPCRYISSVSSDNYGGSVQLMEHLIALRHRRIAYVSGIPPETRKTLSDRVDGYVLSLNRAGLTVDPALIITSLTEANRRSPGADGSPTQVHTAVKSLLAQGVTAVLCEHDQIAFELTIACREMHIKVPEQLSICGFDNSEWAQMIPGGITTVEQNMGEVGRRTAALLLEGLGAPITHARQIVIPTEFVPGATTCAAE